MQKISIQVQPRTITGRASKQLRQQGILPAVLYGSNFESRNIQVDQKDFIKLYKEAGESTLVYLKLDGQEYPTIVHDVKSDPVSDEFVHADFYKVRLDEKIHAKIPVVVVGESPAVKGLGGILVKNINEIEVEGFPQDLPHEFSVDISKLVNFGDQIQVKDLAVPANIKIEAGLEDIVALVQEPISEEELKKSLETAPAPSADEVEVIKKEKKEEEPAEEPATAAPADKTEKKEEKK